MDHFLSALYEEYSEYLFIIIKSQLGNHFSEKEAYNCLNQVFKKHYQKEPRSFITTAPKNGSYLLH
ncbi:MAG: hypothetical protein Q4B70_00365 [Lachnospiraceae bacterium]|nr:hypothetical protein [Lachnospiraceae bacterium]